jgi:hypothetical protein
MDEAKRKSENFTITSKLAELMMGKKSECGTAG